MSVTSGKPKIVALVLFAVAFGYLEAAIVVYLRTIYQPIRVGLHPGRSVDDLFPLITLDELKRHGWQYERQLYIELGREFSTLVMLAAVAWVACRSRRQWFAAFALMFGVWDVFFYAFLYLAIGWPASIWEWDILFLLPTVWAGPVIAPVLVSVGLIIGGAWVLVCEGRDRPCRLPLWCWAGMTAGGLIVILSFCWDWRNLTAGNMPNPFRWDLFGFGLLGAFACFLYDALRRKSV